MGNSGARTEQRRTRADKDQIRSEVENLLRQVLECVGKELTPYPVPQENGNSQELVFDIQVKNVRYILTRSHVSTSSPSVNLSPREQEIVRLVARGHPNKVIATVLEISPWTVSTHMRRIFSKLAVNSRAEMVARALNEDLLSSQEEISMPACVRNNETIHH